jgi:hypothetical protein
VSSFGVEDPTQDPQDRVGLQETFQTQGIGAGLKQLGSMMVPGSWQDPNANAGTVLQDMVEFSPVGDIKDLIAGITGKQGEWKLDPYERVAAILFSAAPALGMYHIATKVNSNYKLDAYDAAQKLASIERTGQVVEEVQASMLPPKGEPITVPQGVEPPTFGPIDQRGHYKMVQGAATTAARRESEVYSVFDAQSFKHLAQIVSGHARRLDTDQTTGKGAPFERDLTAAEENLRIIGKRVIEKSEPGLYAVPDENNIDPDVVKQELTAAIMASGSFLRAVELGLIDGMDGAKARQFLETQALNSVDQHVNMLDAVADLQTKLQGAFVGPDLVVTPQMRMEKIIWDPNGPEPVKLIQGLITDMFPTTRIFDHQTGRLRNKAAMNDRLKKADWRSLVGEMAGNVARMLEEERIANPERYARSINWYPHANATALYLSNVTGKPSTRIAGLLSVLSPRSQWVPQNLVGAIHLALRYGTELDPRSPEYKEHFANAVNAGGWAEDLYRESSQSVKKKFTLGDGTPDLEGIVAYWGDWDLQSRPAHGEMGVTGATMDIKKLGAQMFMQTDIPLQMILRAAKTHEFGYLIDNPRAPNPVAMDAHSDKDTLGFLYAPEPLGSKGYRTLKEGEDYYSKATGLTYTQEEIKLAADELRRLGWDETRIEKQMNTFLRVLDDTSLHRYNAQRAAIAVAAQAMGLEFTHSAQAASWVNGREKRDHVRALLKKENLTRRELEEVLRDAVSDWAIPDHLEGNPKMTPPVWAITSNISENLDTIDDLTVETVKKMKPTGRANTPGTAVITSSLEDGSMVVFAATDIKGVREVLRHAAPTSIRVGKFQAMVPRKPHIVRNVRQHMKDLTSQVDTKGNPVVGESRMYMATADGLYLPQHVGNWFIMELDPKQLDRFLNHAKGLEGALDPIVQPGVVASRNALNRKQYTMEELDQVPLERWYDQENSPLVTNDWVAISSQTDVFDPELHEQLAQDIRDMGGKPVQAAGSYMGDTEPSWFAFGLDYNQAQTLREKYNQESFSTPRGLVYADKLVPATGPLVFGKKAYQRPGFTSLALPDGREMVFSQEFDSDASSDYDPKLQQSFTPTTSKRVRVGFNLGADVGLDFHVTDKIWKELRNQPGVLSAEAHLHGGAFHPTQLERVYETVYADQSGQVGLWRTGQDNGGANQYDVWVEPEVAAQLGKRSDSLAAGTRTLKDVRAYLRESEGTLYVDEDLEIVFDPEADVKIGKHLFDSSVDGKAVRVAAIDLSGDIPRVMMGVEQFGPGTAKIVLNKTGAVSKVEAFSMTDGHRSVEALRLAGVTLTARQMKVGTQVVDIDFQPSAGQTRLIDGGLGWKRGMVADTPEAIQLADKMALKVDDMASALGEGPGKIQFRLGNATERTANVIADTFLALRYGHGNGPVARAIKEYTKYGIWGTERIQVADIYLPGKEKNTGYRYKELMGAVVPGADHGEIWLNENMIVKNQEGGYNMTADIALKSRGWGPITNADVVEVTLAHESMHIVEGDFRRAGLLNEFKAKVIQGFEEMGGFVPVRSSTTKYASASYGEFIADLWTTAVYNPERITPQGRQLLLDVFSAHAALKDGYKRATVKKHLNGPDILGVTMNRLVRGNSEPLKSIWERGGRP